MRNSNNNVENGKVEINQLVSKLKDKDLNYSKITKRGQYIYGILTIIYVIVFTIDLINEFTFSSLISGVCYLAAFAIFYLVLKKYSIEYGNVDYAEPTLEMLKKAAYRYQPFQKVTGWVFLAVLLMGFGIYQNKSLTQNATDMLYYFAIPIMSGLVIGLIVWYYKYKPLRDEALALIKEIEQ